MSDTFSFSLSDEFVNKYSTIPAPFGFSDAGSNSLGEITFIRTYSRMKENGTKERWHEVCKRVIEGMYSVQKNHAKENRLRHAPLRNDECAAVIVCGTLVNT